MDQPGVTDKMKGNKGVTVNNRTEDDMANLHPDRSDQWSVKLLMFYNKHFPTDKDSFAVRLPVVALALSLCSIQIFVNLQWNEYRDRREYFVWALIILVSAATYGLYYGIKIGDRKQFTPWIIFKIIEIITTIVSLMNALLRGHLYGNLLINFIVGFIALGGNMFMIYMVSRRKRENLKDMRGIDEFSPVIGSV